MKLSELCLAKVLEHCGSISFCFRRLHEIINCVQRKNPSKTDPQMIEEVDALQSRAKRVESVLETTKDRLEELDDIKAFDRLSVDDVPEFTGKLNDEQLGMLMTKLKNK